MTKMILRYLITLLALSFSGIALADSFYCSKTANYVEYGSEQSTVMQACGQPISKTKKIIEVKEPVHVVNYVYRFDQGSASGQTPNMPVRSPTIRSPVVVSFINNQVSSISVSGSKAGNTDACDKSGNNSISLGMTQAQVGQVCGLMPDEFYGEDTERVVGKKSIEVWTYQFDPNGPLVEFNFEDGKLTGVSQ